MLRLGELNMRTIVCVSLQLTQPPCVVETGIGVTDSSGTVRILQRVESKQN